MTAPRGGADDSVPRVTLNTVYQQQLADAKETADIKGSLVLLTQNQAHAIEMARDHEQRLRELEQTTIKSSDFQPVETRVGILEASVLTKGGMYAFLGVAVACCGALATFVSLAIKMH